MFFIVSIVMNIMKVKVKVKVMMNNFYQKKIETNLKRY